MPLSLCTHLLPPPGNENFTEMHELDSDEKVMIAI